MSGGHFDYYQWQINDIANSIEDYIYGHSLDEEDDWDDYCYKNFTNATTTVYAKNNTKTINKLTSGKYYVRIRANEKNHYGAWSSIKSIKVK